MATSNLKADLVKRLRFIEGQARGVQAMVEDERDLVDVLTQLLAIQSAARAASELIVRDRMVRRLHEAINRVVVTCAGECEFCDELEGLQAALADVDLSTVVEEVVRLR